MTKLINKYTNKLNNKVNNNPKLTLDEVIMDIKIAQERKENVKCLKT